MRLGEYLDGPEAEHLEEFRKSLERTNEICYIMIMKEIAFCLKKIKPYFSLNIISIT